MNYIKLLKSDNPYTISVSVYKKKLFKVQDRVLTLCWEYNSIKPSNKSKKQTILAKLFHKRVNAVVRSSFHCDYGFNIHCGENTFLNYGVIILDSSPVFIGDNTDIAPYVCISCSGHPLNYKQRTTMTLTSKPIKIGNRVWIGAHSFVNAGVTIGNNSVIGAGSVVTHNIPSDVIAFGSPCKVYRKITNKDLIKNIIH